MAKRHSIRFDLKGWEIIPESEQRGETYEATRNPISQYSRALNQLTPGRLRPGQLLMHPGPVNRGVELSGEAIDSPQALIGAQVRAGVAVRMAVLYELLVGSPTLAAVA